MNHFANDCASTTYNHLQLLSVFASFFSDVVTTDKGVYTCNLHHHYCQIHQSIQVQLNVTKSGEAIRWCSRMLQLFTLKLKFIITCFFSSERETLLGRREDCLCGPVGQLSRAALCEPAGPLERRPPGGPAAGGPLGLPAPWCTSQQG